MENQLRIRNYPNDKEAIQFLPDQADLLSDQSMVMTMHYTRGYIKDDQTVDGLFVGKKGYNFFIPECISNEINKMIKKRNMPLLMNVHLRDGRNRDFIMKHALIVATRPKNNSDEYKPLVGSDKIVKFTFRPFEKKRSIVVSLTPAPKAYLDRLIDISKK